MKIFMLTMVPSDRILNDAEKFDHIVFGCHPCASLEAAQKRAQSIVEEFQSEALEWRRDDQLDVWVATDDSEDGWVIAEHDLVN